MPKIRFFYFPRGVSRSIFWLDFGKSCRIFFFWLFQIKYVIFDVLVSDLLCFHWPRRSELKSFRKKGSLRSRRLEVAGERENGRARGRHACLLLARPFFLVPTTSKRLLRRLKERYGNHFCSIYYTTKIALNWLDFARLWQTEKRL